MKNNFETRNLKSLTFALVLAFSLTSIAQANPNEDCVSYIDVPECPINRCHPDYYQAMANYVGAVSCKEAIQVIKACGHANTGTRPAVAAATASCDADKTVSQTTKRKAAALQTKCLRENKDEGGTMGAYIRTACKLDAYETLIP